MKKKRRELIAGYRRCLSEGKKLPDLAPGWVNEMLESLDL